MYDFLDHPSESKILGIASSAITTAMATVYGLVFRKDGPDMLIDETIIKSDSQSKAITAPINLIPGIT